MFDVDVQLSFIIIINISNCTSFLSFFSTLLNAMLDMTPLGPSDAIFMRFQYKVCAFVTLEFVLFWAIYPLDFLEKKKKMKLDI